MSEENESMIMTEGNDSASKLWFGIVVVALLLFIIYLFSKTRAASPATSNQLPPIIQENEITLSDTVTSAKDAFVRNINLFVPLFDELSAGRVDISKWNDAVISTDSNNLLSVWSKYLKNVSLWENQLASWGIKRDSCVAFVAMEFHKEYYEDVDGRELQMGIKYKVVSSCWNQTITDKNGNCSKTVVKKGIVKECSNE